MNNKDFITTLSRQCRFTTRVTQQLVDALVGQMSAHLEDGTPVTINTFGTFDVKKKLERVVVNPATGQRLMTPPKLVVTFKAGASLKDYIQEKGGTA
ncbi:MAG: HU family DNA-binding protein [Bacteroidaceae bacterium]|nr:HU family DNA-binding protein [Bacteroidaceae bacterium]